ncbi:enolase C-terminal domain-like protein [Streptomyces sp. NPDC001274]
MTGPNAVPADSGPRVSAVGAAAYTVPTDSPEADGTLTWKETTLVVVHARSDGATGLGYTYGAAAATAVVEDLLAGVVTGLRAWDPPGANEAMRRAVRNAGYPGLVAGAVSAVDIALWDLKARLLGLPLVDLLGAVTPDVPVYGSGGFTTYSARQQDHQLRDWVETLGIPRVKMKIGESWGKEERRDRTRIAAARSSIGEAAELYVDANGAYTRKQAIRLASFLGDEAVTWFEEPVSSDDLAGLARVRAAVLPDVTAGEYGCTPAYFRAMVDAGAVDCLQADATRCGGVTGWLRAASLADAAGLQLSAHCAPHVHAHTAAAIPNLRHAEWFHDHVRVEQRLLDGVLSPAGGTVCPGGTGRPGLGLELREESAERYRVGP